MPLLFCPREHKISIASMKIDKNSLFAEIVRFVVIGVYGTLIDLAVEGWLTSVVSSKTAGASHVVAFFALFAISVVGFLVATPATWSLTSVWGFQNVREEDEKKAKSFKGILIFTFWAALGLLIGGLVQFLGYMTCLEWTPLNINILGGFNFEEMFVKGNINVFVAWLIVFVVRTAVTMTWNFITRKIFIYRAPKAEQKGE